MKESHRGQIRRTLMIYLDCIDTATSREVGKIVDITCQGMLLMSNTPLEKGVTGEYRLELPKLAAFKEKNLSVQASCRWIRPAESPDLYYMGLLFTKESSDLEEVVNLLVEHIGFSDGQKKISTTVGDFIFE